MIIDINIYVIYLLKRLQYFNYTLTYINRDGMFDYVEFTRILKHGAKDPDDK